MHYHPPPRATSALIFLYGTPYTPLARHFAAEVNLIVTYDSQNHQQQLFSERQERCYYSQAPSPFNQVCPKLLRRPATNLNVGTKIPHCTVRFHSYRFLPQCGRPSAAKVSPQRSPPNTKFKIQAHELSFQSLISAAYSNSPLTITLTSTSKNL